MRQPNLAFQPIAALRSRYVFNWRTHLFYALSAASSAFLNDFLRLGGDPNSWILLTVIAYIVTIISIEALSGLRDRLGLKTMIITSVLILVLAGLFRGITLLYGGQLMGLVPDSDWAYRIFGGPIYVLTNYIIFNGLVNSFLTQRDAEQKLRSESQSLRHSRELFAKEIERLRLERAAKVREFIAPSLWEISKRLGDAKLLGKTADLIQALRETNEKVVRPLSRNLFTEAELPTLTTIPTMGKLVRLTLPRRIRLGNSLSVTFLISISLAMGYASQVLNVGFYQAVINVAAAGVYFGTLSYLVKYLTARIEHSTWIGLLVSIVLGGAIGYSVITIIDYPGIGFNSDFPIQSAAFFAIGYPSSYLLAVTTAQRNRTLTELEEVVASLQVLNSQLRQQVWLDQKLLATELHGSVQATLHAAALSLANNPAPKAEDFDKVLVSVQQVVDRLGDAGYLEGASIWDVLDDIAVVWEDSCEIGFKISESAHTFLNNDPKAARSVIEVVRETITNAIKHNSAKEILVALTTRENLIEVVITNQGLLAVAKELGSGSEIMAELTFKNSLEQVGNEVVLTALIPQSLEAAK